MIKWARANYMPNKPLYEGKMNVTGGEDHLALCRKAAREGMVLLKNDNKLLPFHKGQKVAIFGKGLFDYVKGGGGSGDVSVAYVHNLYDGFHLLNDSIDMYEPLASFYRSYVEEQYAQGAKPGQMMEPELSEQMVNDAASFADTALIVLSRFSAEGWDRKSLLYDNQEEWEKNEVLKSQKIFGDCDYYLTQEEEKMIQEVKDHFDKIAVVLNVGGVVDTNWFVRDEHISSALLAWQGGMEGGLATAELLMGLDNPCGKLPDTFAKTLEDYPSTETFHDSLTHVDYKEDIYVGYRYFETIKGKKERVNYPFGYGLSYSTFSIHTVMGTCKDNRVFLTVRVRNTGKMAGREVVQVYMQAPQGLLGKAKRSLVAFGKTKKLKPGETEVMTFEIPFERMTSYDDLGKVKKDAYILEEGEYCFYVSNCVRRLGGPSDKIYSDYWMKLGSTKVVQTLSEKCAPEQLAERMLADGTMEALPQKEPTDYKQNALGQNEWIDGLAPITRGRDRYSTMMKDPSHIDLIDVYEGRKDMDSFLEQLTDLELADLLGGQPNKGVANTYGFGNNPVYGIPNVMTTDGPAGVRILPEYEIYTTAWPCATQLASTWDEELLYQVGVMAGEEIKENNLCVWLAPAINIHRNPLCGRNFEYYSEDPVLAGELAGAMVAGVQSMGVAATIKHFACNNKETNRRESDSRISQRALREIYLKAFEIIVKKAQPMCIMSSYNLINGCRASECKELLEDILRGEWGYDGLVCSDWFTRGEHYKELLAGNDIKMGTGFPERLMEALEVGAISREDLIHSAKRVLNLIMKLD